MDVVEDVEAVGVEVAGAVVGVEGAVVGAADGVSKREGQSVESRHRDTRIELKWQTRMCRRTCNW